MTYECFLKPGWCTQDIEAENSVEAKRKFIALLRDNLSVEHVDTNNLDTETGEDPA